MAPIKIYFVDDHPIVLRGLKQFFATVGDVEVVGTHRDGALFWTDFCSGALAPIDVLILDIDTPGLDGIQVFENVKRARPELPILFYTRQPEDQFAARLLRRGAAGFLSKDRDTDELVRAIHAAYAGEIHTTPSLTAMLVGREGTSERLHDRLSGREKEVFDLYARGLTPGEIAAKLDVSPSTVSSYFNRIRKKLELSTTPEIVQYAYRNKLVR